MMQKPHHEQEREKFFQRLAEFSEDTHGLCNNPLAIKNDSFVLNYRFFGETTLFVWIPIITIKA